MSISLKFHLYHIYQKHDCKLTKRIGFDLCIYSYVYIFMYTNYFLSR